MMLHVRGSYALGICLRRARRAHRRAEGRPLMLGCGDGSLIASDVTALLRYTRTMYYMDNWRSAVITAGRHRVVQRAADPVRKGAPAHRLGRGRRRKRRLRALSCSRRSTSSPPPSRDTITRRIQDGRIDLSELDLDDGGHRGCCAASASWPAAPATMWAWRHATVGAWPACPVEVMPRLRVPLQ